MKTAYEFGALLALREAGLVKEAALPTWLVGEEEKRPHPVARRIGGGLGGALTGASVGALGAIIPYTHSEESLVGTTSKELQKLLDQKRRDMLMFERASRTQPAQRLQLEKLEDANREAFKQNYEKLLSEEARGTEALISKMLRRAKILAPLGLLGGAALGAGYPGVGGALLGSTIGGLAGRVGGPLGSLIGSVGGGYGGYKLMKD